MSEVVSPPSTFDGRTSHGRHQRQRSSDADALEPTDSLPSWIRLAAISPAEQARCSEVINQGLVNRVASGEIAPDTPEFFDAAEIIEGALPDNCRAALTDLRSGAADAIVLRGLPVDARVSDTPAAGRDPATVPIVGHACVAMCIRRLGYEFAYALEKSGCTVQDIYPTPRAATAQSNGSWKVDLSLHTENAFHAIRPDYVALYCVRAPAVPPATTLVRLDDVLTGLSDAEIEVLREARFTIRVVESFRAEGERDVALPAALLGGPLRRPTIRWHESVAAEDEVANAALVRFAAAARAVMHQIRLQRSDLLAFANDRCLHGRQRFDARLDGRDRWLLRAYALRDATRIAPFIAPTRPRVLQVDPAAPIGSGA